MCEAFWAVWAAREATLGGLWTQLLFFVNFSISSYPPGDMVWYSYKWSRLFEAGYLATDTELVKSVEHGPGTVFELLKNQISGAYILGKPSIEYRFRCDIQPKIMICTSLNEIEISTFYAFQCHSIGVLWFLGVLWDCGKAICSHSDILGDCIHKIKCSHEKTRLSWLLVTRMRLGLTSWECC